VTGSNRGVGVRWLPGLGSAPGAVDLTANGPTGPMTRAVTLPAALAASVVIDLLCPGSDWYGIVRQLPTCPTSDGSTT
jgi:hypothetical protein